MGEREAGKAAEVIVRSLAGATDRIRFAESDLAGSGR